MSSPIIELQTVAKAYETRDVRTWALRDVTMDVLPGTLTVFWGPSGSGKSTLLSILGLCETPTQGSYRFAGHEMGTLSAKARARVRNERMGYVFQAFNLISEMTVEENISLPLRIAGMAPAARRQRVEDLAEQLGLTPRLRHHPWQLSGGQQQRVAIARALSMRPQVLLCDEPTGNLDTVNGNAVWDLLRAEQAGGTTVMVVTHNPELAKQAEVLWQVRDGTVASMPLNEAEFQQHSFTVASNCGASASAQFCR